MTDDLDRRMDARITRALRMLADLAKELHHWDGKYIRQAADAIDPPEPEKPLPCPFCGGNAVREDDGDWFMCGNRKCRFHQCLDLADWNRRVEVPHLDTGLRIGLACRLNTEEAEVPHG